jgi:hypothetical protein
MVLGARQQAWLLRLLRANYSVGVSRSMQRNILSLSQTRSVMEKRQAFRWPQSKVPQYNYGDMVDAQYRLLSEGLGVRHVRLIIGNSMGGMNVWL